MRPTVADATMRSMSRLVSILGLALALTACSEGAPPSPRAATPRPVATATPACLDGQVRARTEQVEGLMAGVGMVRIFLTNASAAPCRLDGKPDVLPLGEGGHVLPHTSATLDGDFGGAVGATLAPETRDAAYIPVSVTGRDASLEPCPTQRSAPIRGWRVTFARWSRPVDVLTVGDIRFCDGRLRSGGVKPNQARERLTTPTLPPAQSP